jgi:nucleotide-binding universal stress UspA family protein
VAEQRTRLTCDLEILSRGDDQRPRRCFPISYLSVAGGFAVSALVDPYAQESQTGCGHGAELATYAESSVGRGLHELAERQRADLLVVGSCHRGMLGRVLLGDDTRAAINGAPCAIAIAPSGYAEMPHRLGDVGIGYDASPESHQALAAARALAERHGSTIRALSVVSLQNIPYGEPIPVGWPQIAAGLVDDELKRFHDFEDVEGDAIYGEPSEELAHFSEELDLLIVGSRSYGPIGRVFNGSTSNYLARRARCPLLVLPRSAASGAEAEIAEREMPIGLRS